MAVIGNPIILGGSGGGGGGGFTPSDEGKVVSNGALVAQGSQTVTQNGTYDTTLISELIANISGGGGVTKTLLYSFNESQGNSWINTEVDISNIETLMFEDVRSDVVQKEIIINVADIAIYTGGTDVYTMVYTQTKPMNARIYNNYLYVSYNGTGASTNVTKIYEYVETSSGGGAKNILSGTSAPSSSQGSDGAIYLQYAPAGIKNTSGNVIQTGYSGNTNTKIVCDFMITKAQTGDWPTLFGGRPNAGNVTNSISYQFAKGTKDYTGGNAAWNENVNISGAGVTGLLRKKAHLELSNGLIKIDAFDVAVSQSFTTANITSTTEIALFGHNVNGTPQPFGQTAGIIIYRFQIYESDVLIHDFIPAKDTNDIVCLYDEIAEEYKYPNTGTMDFVYEGEIVDTYLKVNGTWQQLIGSDNDDVDTGGGVTPETVLETASVFRWYYTGATTAWGVMKKSDGDVIGQNIDNANANVTMTGSLMTVLFHGTSQNVTVTANESITLKAYSSSRTLGEITPIEYNLSSGSTQSFTMDNVYGGLYLEATPQT